MNRWHSSWMIGVFLATACAGVFAYSGSVSPTVAWFGNGTDDTGSRALIRLQRAGRLLYGRPRTGMVELVTLYAPGSEPTWLIVRELEHADETRSVLISAPPVLERRVRRATLLLKESASVSATLRSQQGGLYDGQPVSADGFGVNSGDSTLHAYSVDGLGLFWVGGAERQLSGAAPVSARAAVGGSLVRGLSPIAWALVVLALSAWISRRVFNDAQHAAH